jgi:hypothetical protein
MHIVSMAKFIIGLVFLAVALALLPRALKERGLGKYRQLAALSLVAAAIFVARGLGLVSF